MNDISNLFSIRVELNGILAIPTNIIVLGLYDSYLTFDYIQYAEVTSLTPSSAPPVIEYTCCEKYLFSIAILYIAWSAVFPIF